MQLNIWDFETLYLLRKLNNIYYINVCIIKIFKSNLTSIFDSYRNSTYLYTFYRSKMKTSYQLTLRSETIERALFATIKKKHLRNANACRINSRSAYKFKNNGARGKVVVRPSPFVFDDRKTVPETHYNITYQRFSIFFSCEMYNNTFDKIRWKESVVSLIYFQSVLYHH